MESDEIRSIITNLNPPIVRAGIGMAALSAKGLQLDGSSLVVDLSRVFGG